MCVEEINQNLRIHFPNTAFYVRKELSEISNNIHKYMIIIKWAWSLGPTQEAVWCTIKQPHTYYIHMVNTFVT